MVFLLSDGYDIRAFFKSLSLVILGESLGGVESIATHPATMTHAAIPPEIRRKTGIADNLIRLSVGIEDKADIADDLNRAFDAAAQG